MATLGKIRNRSGLLLTVIGVAMLAFILGDFMSSLSSNRGGSIYVGEVLGEDVTIQAFEVKVEEGINNWKSQSQQIELSETIRAEIRSDVWDQYVRGLIMDNEFDKLGIEVSDKEWMERISGANIHPQILRYFGGNNGNTVDGSTVLEHLKQIDQDPTGQAKKSWVGFQKYLLALIKTSKYNSLVTNAMYVTDEEARLNFNENSQNITFNYVKIPFSSVAGNTVEPTESEIKTYYTNHKANYEQPASKDVDFVVFSVVPSTQDSESAKSYVEDLKADFLSRKDYNLMASKYSDNTSARFTFTTKEGLADTNWRELFDAEQGAVIGPYQSSPGVYRIAKLAIAQNRPDSVEARHILIKYSETPTPTMKGDSVIAAIKAQIQAGADFGILANKYSDDNASKNKGGDLGWFSESTTANEFMINPSVYTKDNLDKVLVMIDALNEACFSSKIGDLTIVPSPLGFHLIELTNTTKAMRKVKIAFIDRNVEPSNETDQIYLAQANSFAVKILNEGMAFDTLVAQQNLVKRSDSKVTADKQSIVGLPNSREMVKWMNTTDEGTVSKVFSFENFYVVAYLTKEHIKGNIPLKDIKEQISGEVVKDKQAAHITASIAGTDLATIAANNGQTIVNAQKTNLANLKLSGIGYEPALVGSIFGTTVGSVSSPIVGTDAIYVIEVTAKDEAKTTVDFTKQKQEIKKGIAAYVFGTPENRFNGAAYKVLNTEADVKDNLSVIY